MIQKYFLHFFSKYFCLLHCLQVVASRPEYQVLRAELPGEIFLEDLPATRTGHQGLEASGWIGPALHLTLCHLLSAG